MRMPGPGREPQATDHAARRHEVARRVLGVDAALDRGAARRERGGGQREPLPVGDLDLLGHEVEPGDHLGDRVLDLEPRVHLEEVEVAARRRR